MFLEILTLTFDLYCIFVTQSRHAVLESQCEVFIRISRALMGDMATDTRTPTQDENNGLANLFGARLITPQCRLSL